MQSGQPLPRHCHGEGVKVQMSQSLNSRMILLLSPLFCLSHKKISGHGVFIKQLEIHSISVFKYKLLFGRLEHKQIPEFQKSSDLHPKN